MKLNNFMDYCYDQRSHPVIRVLKKGTPIIPVYVATTDLPDDVCGVEEEVLLEIDWFYDETYQISSEVAALNRRIVVLPKPSEHPIISDHYYVGFLVKNEILGF